MAVVRRVDLAICGEQWATSRAADLTYSHIISSFTRASSSHSGGSVWIRPFDCSRRTPATSETVAFFV